MSIFDKVCFLEIPLYDNIDYPYIVKYRPKISTYVESLRNTRSFDKYFREGRLEIREITQLKQVENIDKFIREEYTKVHSEQLYLSLRSQPHFKPLMHMFLTLADEIIRAVREGYIPVTPCIPPDLWAGKTYVRKCSIFSFCTYLAKRLGGKTAIVSLDVHYGYGIQDILEYEEEGEGAEGLSEEYFEEPIVQEEEQEEIEEGEEGAEEAAESRTKIFYLAVCSMGEVDSKIFRKAKKKKWLFLPVTVPPGVRDDVYLKVVDYAFRIVRVYEPENIIFLLGLDMYREDVIGEFVLSCDAFYDIGQLIMFLTQAMYLKSVIILIECVSTKESIQKPFPNLIAGLLGAEKPYYDPIRKESTQAVKDLTNESLEKLRRLLIRHWKVKVPARIRG